MSQQARHDSTPVAEPADTKTADTVGQTKQATSRLVQPAAAAALTTSQRHVTVGRYRPGQPMLATATSHQHQLVPLANLQRTGQLAPLRPNLKRQVMLATCEPLPRAQMQLCEPVDIRQGPSDLAAVQRGAGGLREPGEPANASGSVPPRRPAHSPSRYATLTGRYRTFGKPSATAPPNRYAHWAQMHPSAASQHDGGWSPSGEDAGAAVHQHHHNKFQHHFSAASRVLVVNPMQIVNLSEHTKSKLIKSIEAIKRFSEKWFSHILLLLFLAVYACFGAYIFISFEANNEIWEKQLLADTRQKILNETWPEAHATKEQQVFYETLESKLDEYERLLNRACVSGMNSKSLENQWTFWGALFYSMTVFTTIGYGHLVPITFAGRVATMVYAIFGIPILLMVLADLGKLLTRIIKSAFKKFRNLYYKCLSRKSSVRTRKLISDNTSQYLGAARGAFERGLTYIQPAVAPNGRLFAINMSRSKQKQQQQPHLTDEQLAISASEQPQADGDALVAAAPVASGEQKVSPNDKKSSALPSHHSPSHFKRSQSPGLAPAGKRKVSLCQSASHKSLAKITSHHQASAKTTTTTPESNLLQSQSATIVNTPITEADAEKAVEIKPDAAVAGQATGAGAGAGAAAPDQFQTAPDPEAGGGGGCAKSPDARTSATFEASQADELDDGDEQDLEDELDIPVSFALFLLVTYMMFGAVVFSIWEGWNFFDSLYFVFISMSTIGFGDLVPQQPKRMIGTFIYLLFGLALTSMCINVVQEKIHASFLRAKMQIGEKMGFDLDQIMADDYYHDGSYAGLSEYGDNNLEEEEEDTTSVAMSQSNSLVGQPACGPTTKLLADNRDTGGGGGDVSLQDASIDGLSEPIAAVSAQPTSVKQSRSNSSIRSKKRTLNSLAAHSGHPERSSMFRKSHNKKSFRVQQSAPAAPMSPTGGQPMAAPATPPLAETPLAAKQQISLAPPIVPVVAQVEPPTPTLTPEPQQQQQPLQVPNAVPLKPTGSKTGETKSPTPSLALSAREIMEEASRFKLAAQSASLRTMSPIVTATRSQSMRSPSGPSRSPNNYNNNKQRPNRVSEITRPGHLSAGSSRRASLSRELNQLDDIISALGSQTTLDRYKPLLGIPTPPQTSTTTLTASRSLSMRANSTSPSMSERRTAPIDEPANVDVGRPATSGQRYQDQRRLMRG